MKIYLSSLAAARRAIGSDVEAALTCCGWGHLCEMTQKYLVELGGVDIVETPEEASVELFIGHPPLQYQPELHPAVMLTMSEATGVPQDWVTGMDNYDIILTPSRWGVNNYERAGTKTPVRLCHLCVDTDRFKYIKRDIHTDGKWVFLAQSVFPSDRKGIWAVEQYFSNGLMPADTFLIMKTRPDKGQQPFEQHVDEQVFMYYNTIPFDRMMSEVLVQSHVSVNPSSGEGFGYIPLEHQLTGMIAIQTNYSGMADTHNPLYNLPIEYREVFSQLAAFGGKDAQPDYEHMYKQMLWTYENREKSLEMGRLASKWVAEQFSPTNFVNTLLRNLNMAIESRQKTINLYDPSKSEEWFNPRRLGARMKNA